MNRRRLLQFFGFAAVASVAPAVVVADELSFEAMYDRMIESCVQCEGVLLAPGILDIPGVEFTAKSMNDLISRNLVRAYYDEPLSFDTDPRRPVLRYCFTNYGRNWFHRNTRTDQPRLNHVWESATVSGRVEAAYTSRWSRPELAELRAIMRGTRYLHTNYARA